MNAPQRTHDPFDDRLSPAAVAAVITAIVLILWIAVAWHHTSDRCLARGGILVTSADVAHGFTTCAMPR